MRREGEQPLRTHRLPIDCGTLMMSAQKGFRLLSGLSYTAACRRTGSTLPIVILHQGVLIVNFFPIVFGFHILSAVLVSRHTIGISVVV